ncbi:hypothetical protein CDEF62S_01146 [Castellaniella defragrans]
MLSCKYENYFHMQKQMVDIYSGDDNDIPLN